MVLVTKRHLSVIMMTILCHDTDGNISSALPFRTLPMCSSTDPRSRRPVYWKTSKHHPGSSTRCVYTLVSYMITLLTRSAPSSGPARVNTTSDEIVAVRLVTEGDIIFAKRLATEGDRVIAKRLEVPPYDCLQLVVSLRTPRRLLSHQRHRVTATCGARPCPCRSPG